MEVGTASDYPRSFEAVWKITKKRLCQHRHSRNALHLLQILAYSDPDAVPVIKLKEVYTASLPEDMKGPVDDRFDSARKPLMQIALF